MTRKRFNLIMLVSVTSLALITAFAVGFGIDTSSRARNKLGSEITSLEERKNELEAEKEEINSKLSELETELSTKATVNNYYMEYRKTYDQLTSEIASLEKQSEELDAEISQKEAEAEKAGKIKGTVRGKTYSVVKDEVYTCPDKIPAGRYIVSGHGTLVIYASNGKTRIAENLDVAYNNSYTFDLKDKEKFKVSANASLTELK